MCDQLILFRGAHIPLSVALFANLELAHNMSVMKYSAELVQAKEKLEDCSL